MIAILQLKASKHFVYFVSTAVVTFTLLNNLDNRINLFLDECFEHIRKHLKLKRFPISKYLNTIYRYYCDKGDIEYKPLNNSKIIKLDDNIIEILNRVYLKYPHIKIEEPLYDFDVDYL